MNGNDEDRNAIAEATQENPEDPRRTIPLRVLILEDHESDAQLMIRQLKRSGFEPVWQRVETEAEYMARLASLPDVILSDYRMPEMDAERALEILRESALPIPFIVVSGAIGEDVAVAMMRKGATDYLLKDRMARLGPAVRHALNQRLWQERTRRAGEELRASEVRFQSFMNNSPTLARIKDADGRILYMNSTCEHLFAVSVTECAGKTDGELWPAEIAERLRSSDLAVMERGEPSRTVEQVTLPNGRTLELLTFRFLLYDSAGQPMLGEVSADISEQIRTQKALAESLAAREVLFRELHHRVKNNLNVVSSLLSMQAQILGNSPAGKALWDAQRRIESMAQIHERLNNHENADRVDFGEYAAALARSLVHAFRGADTAVRLRLELNPVSLALTEAIPCGLILNELLTNALKYAFPDNRSGEITVSLEEDSNRAITLGVSDDGVGLPDGLDLSQSDSLGLRIVHILTRQLDGKLEVRGGAGASFALTFPGAQPPD